MTFLISDGKVCVRRHLVDNCRLLSNFDWPPSSLFDGCNSVRLHIIECGGEGFNVGELANKRRGRGERTWRRRCRGLFECLVKSGDPWKQHPNKQTRHRKIVTSAGSYNPVDDRWGGEKKFHAIINLTKLTPFPLCNLSIHIIPSKYQTTQKTRLNFWFHHAITHLHFCVYFFVHQKLIPPHPPAIIT
jgi:hypothetical protein